MDPITIGLLAGGGLGLLKGLGNEKKEAAQAEFRKQALKYAPWTGMSDPGALNLPGAFESALQGAAMGGMTGGSLKQADAASKYLSMQIPNSDVLTPTKKAMAAMG